MIIVTTLVVIVVGVILYRRHTSLKPMSELEVRELHQKFHDAYKDVDPKPKLNFMQNAKRQPAYLYVTQGKNDFLMLSWDNNHKTPSLKKYSRDHHYYATHEFLEHFNIKPPQ